MAKLQIEGAVNTQAQVEFELARVQRALVVTENASLRAESKRGVAQEAMAMAGEACRKAEVENNSLKDERLALVMELGTIRMTSSPYRRRPLLIERRWRLSSMQAALRCSTMAMVVTYLRTTYAGASLRSRMECRILQSR